MKDFLIKRGVKIHDNLNVCPWCNRELERADHVLFNCNFIAGFWKRIFNWWDIGWLAVSNFEEFYLLCFKAKIIGSCKSMWLTSIAVSCWSIRLARNEIVFYNKVLTMDTLIFHSKLRALLWVRAAAEECRFQERLWWLYPYRCRLSNSGSAGWCFPPLGCLKFNVSGVALEGESSVGGVMRDKEGIVRALFSGPSVACEVESAELGAIIIAMDVFSDIGWKGSCFLIVEMGSREELDRMRVCARKLTFTLAEAGGNEMADALASAGISRPCLFKAWW
ncbi:hypothetical protein E1A91_A05G439600v1 [Gossypium mustelinum]|uniref:Reverse transcriptase zinc-binding domain-containing protein n=1 Tax=Gossypium mustelinum TaxID=34275 RepID=A0A5D2ZKZ3_GOSMU|nr:hypothetical protein E1A91_A05G439600v1 [Gossypium mustelinum]